MQYDELDKKIYRAMIELGWIIAATEEEVKWFEKANKDLEVPKFDFNKCLAQIRQKLNERKNNL